jgi:hypothetical protein
MAALLKRLSLAQQPQDLGNRTVIMPENHSMLTDWIGKSLIFLK